MDYEVQILIGRNTFWTFEVTNYDDPIEQVETDMRQVASRVGGVLLYVNKKEQE